MSSTVAGRDYMPLTNHRLDVELSNVSLYQTSCFPVAILYDVFEKRGNRSFSVVLDADSAYVTLGTSRTTVMIIGEDAPLTTTTGEPPTDNKGERYNMHDTVLFIGS